MADGRKKYLLRIPHELYATYERWAADEFRSVNAQIEATLVDAARRAGRLNQPVRTNKKDNDRQDSDHQDGGHQDGGHQDGDDARGDEHRDDGDRDH